VIGANVIAEDQRRDSSPSGALSAFASSGSTPSSREASRLVRMPTFQLLNRLLDYAPYDVRSLDEQVRFLYRPSVTEQKGD
jgi:hypothetical protein